MISAVFKVLLKTVVKCFAGSTLQILATRDRQKQTAAARSKTVARPSPIQPRRAAPQKTRIHATIAPLDEKSTRKIFYPPKNILPAKNSIWTPS
jgi:hypothetical protein